MTREYLNTAGMQTTWMVTTHAAAPAIPIRGTRKMLANTASTPR